MFGRKKKESLFTGFVVEEGTCPSDIFAPVDDERLIQRKLRWLRLKNLFKFVWVTMTLAVGIFTLLLGMWIGLPTVILGLILGIRLERSRLVGSFDVFFIPRIKDSRFPGMSLDDISSIQPMKESDENNQSNV